MLTNRQNLPAPLVNAIRNDPYDAGASRISVTRLIQPPQIGYLLRGREVNEDASGSEFFSTTASAPFIWAIIQRNALSIV